MAGFRLIGKLATPTCLLASPAIPLLLPKVYAEEKSEKPCAKGGETKKKCCCKKGLPKASELPIYGNPEDNLKYELIEQPPGSLEQGISVVRKSAAEYWDSLHDVKEETKRIYTLSLAVAKSTYEHLTDETNQVPKAIAIAAGGIGGLLFGARGGLFKKVFYTSAGMATMASVCYPKVAMELGQQGYQKMKEEGIPTIKEYTGIDLKELFSSLKPKTSAMSPDELGYQVSDIRFYGYWLDLPEPESESAHGDHRATIIGDYGQSNPADRDMYSTRGTI